MLQDESGSQYFRSINNAIGLPQVNVGGIVEDKTGRLITATESGLYCQAMGTTEVEWLEGGNFYSVLLDQTNDLWAGSSDGLHNFENSPNMHIPLKKNLFVYDPRNPNSLSKNVVKSLLIYSTGIIWAGTSGVGLTSSTLSESNFDISEKHKILQV